MTRFRAALLAVLLAHAPAAAGPIAWSYSSGGASEGGYGFDPASLAFDTAAGEVQQIYLANGAHAPWMVSPIPLEGPTLWTHHQIDTVGVRKRVKGFVGRPDRLLQARGVSVD